MPFAASHSNTTMCTALDLLTLLLSLASSQSVDSVKAVQVVADGVHHNRFGAFYFNDWIGRPFGCKVMAKATKKGLQGWVHLLRPTMELWTLTLPHRTQILYAPDISAILTHLDIRPGSVVVESGTGSGSLSHALIRALAPTGHLHTFDFHAARAQQAQQEFEEHGLGHLVTAAHGDACAEAGFGLDGVADAVFLDLPKPWLAIGNARRALRPGGRLCSFSPCIEQVQRACEAMAAAGFIEPLTIETLKQPIEVRRMEMGPPSLVFHDGEPNPAQTLPQDGSSLRFVGVHKRNVAGHTGYLTFATLAP